MSTENLLKKVQDKLRVIAGRKGQKLLEPVEKDQLIKEERNYQKRTEEAGLMEVVNEGFLGHHPARISNCCSHGTRRGYRLHYKRTPRAAK
jgi:hypothetical protein